MDPEQQKLYLVNSFARENGIPKIMEYDFARRRKIALSIFIDTVYTDEAVFDHTVIWYNDYTSPTR